MDIGVEKVVVRDHMHYPIEYRQCYLMEHTLSFQNDQFRTD